MVVRDQEKRRLWKIDGARSCTEDSRENSEEPSEWPDRVSYVPGAALLLEYHDRKPIVEAALRLPSPCLFPLAYFSRCSVSQNHRRASKFFQLPACSATSRPRSQNGYEFACVVIIMESNQAEPLSKLEYAHPTRKVIHASILHLRLSSSTSCGRSSTQRSVPSSTWSAPATSVHAARHNANRVCNKTLRTVQNCIYALWLCDHPGSSPLQTYPDRTSPLTAVTTHSRSV